MQAASEDSKPQPINMSYTSITNMESIVAKAKKWGNSVGIIIPKEVAEREGIRPGVAVEALVKSKKYNPITKTFGMLKGRIKKPTDVIMREIDRELYND